MFFLNDQNNVIDYNFIIEWIKIIFVFNQVHLNYCLN